MIQRRDAWIFFAIVLFAALLRLVVAYRSDLWADEIFSLAMATGHSLEHPAAEARPELGDFAEVDRAVPAEEFRRYLEHEQTPATPARVVRAVFLSDTSPPLYYLSLYAWTLLVGTSDFALRSFSIACALACLPLLAAIARRIGGSGAAFAACILFSFSPVSVYYSTEGRMYALLWLWVLAITWLSLAVHQRTSGVAFEVLWVLVSAAGFLTHYFFVFPWLVIVALLAIQPGNWRRFRLTVCLVATGLLILPWYIHLPDSLSRWRVTADWLKWQPSHFDRLAAFRDLVLQFFESSGRRMTIILLILFALAFGSMFWRLRGRAFTWRRLLLWGVFAAACVGPLVFDLVQHTYTVAVPRYAMAALPAAFLLAGLAVSTLRTPARGILLLLVVSAWSPSLLRLCRDRTPWSPIGRAARAAAVNGAASDLILVHSIPSGVLGVARYETGPADIASWVGQLDNRRAPESLLNLAAGRKRILFIKVHEVGEPAPEEDWLRAHATVAQETRFRFGTLIDFRPASGSAF